MVCSRAFAGAHGLKMRATVRSVGSAGVDPARMGIGARPGQQALKRAGLSASDLDLIELNEAFAVQSLACIRKLKLDRARQRPRRRHCARTPLRLLRGAHSHHAAARSRTAINRSASPPSASAWVKAGDDHRALIASIKRSWMPPKAPLDMTTTRSPGRTLCATSRTIVSTSGPNSASTPRSRNPATRSSGTFAPPQAAQRRAHWRRSRPDRRHRRLRYRAAGTFLPAARRRARLKQRKDTLVWMPLANALKSRRHGGWVVGEVIEHGDVLRSPRSSMRRLTPLEGTQPLGQGPVIHPERSTHLISGERVSDCADRTQESGVSDRLIVAPETERVPLIGCVEVAQLRSWITAVRPHLQPCGRARRSPSRPDRFAQGQRLP